MFVSVEKALEIFKKGEFLLVTDSNSRENEADLMISCSHITPEKMNFLIKEGRGLVCVATTQNHMDQLQLSPMNSDRHNHPFHQTAFYTSIDARQNTTTGISAFDRAQTCKQMSNPHSTHTDFVSPGHIFPLCAHPKGVLGRAGHTEAAIELAQLTNLSSPTVICEVLDDDGTMLRDKNLKKYSDKWSIPICRIDQLIEYRINEFIQKSHIHSSLPTPYGEFRIHLYKTPIDELEYTALVLGDLSDIQDPIPLRIHSQCFTGDVLHSLRCDCRDQLNSSFEFIEKTGYGVILYLPQEGRGIGLYNKIKAYSLQDEGYDTIEANKKLGFEMDLRNYEYAVHILKSLGVHKVSLLTNNPHKVSDLSNNGIIVKNRLPLLAPRRKENDFYLKTKKNKMGHLL